MASVGIPNQPLAATPPGTSGTHANCPVSQPIEGDKPQRTNGFEYNRGTTGTVGTSAVGTDGRCPFHHPRAASSHGVGAEVLAAGGECVDAVIATTFALGVQRS